VIPDRLISIHAKDSAGLVKREIARARSLLVKWHRRPLSADEEEALGWLLLQVVKTHVCQEPIEGLLSRNLRLYEAKVAGRAVVCCWLEARTSESIECS
jgi:hypothetical protein